MIFENLLFDLKVPVIEFQFNIFRRTNDYFYGWEQFFYNKIKDKSNFNVNDFLLTYFNEDVLSDYLHLYYKIKKFSISANNNLSKINVYIEKDTILISIDDTRRLIKLLNSFVYNIIDDFIKNHIFDWKQIIDFLNEKSGASSIYLYLKKGNTFKPIYSISNDININNLYWLDMLKFINSTEIFLEKNLNELEPFKNESYKNYKIVLVPIGRYGELVGFCIFVFKERVNYYIVDIFFNLFNFFYLIIYIYNSLDNRSTFDLSIFDRMGIGCLLIDSQKRVLDFNSKILMYISSLKHFQVVESFFIGDKEINIDSIFSKGIKKDYEQMEVGNEAIVDILYLSNNRRLLLINDIRKDITKFTNKLMEPVSILASGIAHRYNNIMTSVVANINLLQEMLRLGTFNFEDIYSILDKMLKTSMEIKKINQQLITFTEGGSPKLRYGNFRRFILNYFMELKKSIDYINIFIENDIPYTYFSKEQFKIVLDNVIQNSIEAVENLSNPNIDVTLRLANEEDLKQFNILHSNYIVLLIKDNGEICSKDIVDKVFLPFFTTKSTHIGLGLAIAYRIISNHNGVIFVEFDKGFCVYIFLPIIKNKNNNIIRKKKIERILLMDDEEAIREVLKEGLTLLGYKVNISSNFNDTVRLFKEAKKLGTPYDLVILDLIIEGGRGGLDTFVSLKEIDKDILAIAISGYSNNDVMSNYRKYGFVDALTKPFDINDLDKRIKNLSK